MNFRLLPLSKWMMALESRILSIIEKNENRFLLALLRAFSWLYCFFVFIKDLLYTCKIKKEKSAELPVVCVGNITAGGVGKTPFIERLSKDLNLKQELGVISRGYRSIGSRKDSVISPLDQNKKLVDAIYCGDEPYLLQKKLPLTKVLVSKNKRLALQVAKKASVKLALLDDGMQNRSLKKDLLITLVSAKEPFGKGFFLPRGFLRESPKALSRSDYICIADAKSKEEFDLLSKQIKNFSEAKILGGGKHPEGVYGDKTYTLEELKKKKVGAFCGLGRPSQFFDMLEDLGMQVKEKEILADHEAMCTKRLQKFMERCKEVEVDFIVCTEKDYVKLKSQNFCQIPICYLQIAFQIEYGKANYDNLLRVILKLKSKYEKVR